MTLATSERFAFDRAAKSPGAATTYDAAGRTLTEAVVGRNGTPAAATTDTYDSAGQLPTVTDGDGHVTQYAYDLSGRQTAVTQGAGSAHPITTTAAYDGDGRVTQAVDGDGNVTRLACDEPSSPSPWSSFS